VDTCIGRRLLAVLSLVVVGCYVGVDGPGVDATTSVDASTSGSGPASTSTTRATGSSSGNASEPDESSSSSTTDDDEESSSGDDESSSSSSSTGSQTEMCAPMIAGTITETVDVGGLARTYIATVPDSLDGTIEPAPVIMAFHGTDGTAEYASENYDITSDQPAIYVYPQAVYSEELGAVAWNVDSEGIDFAFFDALLEDLATKYCIDETRLHAAGQSNGAFFVHELGCRRNDVLRAIAPVAGGGPAWYPDCTETMTVMMVHGANDTTVPIQTGINARDFWLDNNACNAANVPTALEPCVAYTSCDEPTWWCAHGGDHTWPDFAGATIRAFFLNL
jgi:polyhydroxybutyrate depolymerase